MAQCRMLLFYGCLTSVTIFKTVMMIVSLQDALTPKELAQSLNRDDIVQMIDKVKSYLDNLMFFSYKEKLYCFPVQWNTLKAKCQGQSLVIHFKYNHCLSVKGFFLKFKTWYGTLACCDILFIRINKKSSVIL